MLNQLGKHDKLKILAYDNPEFNGQPNEEFEVFINPEGYSLEYKIEHNEEQPEGTSGNASSFGKIPGKTFNIETIFDRTGVLPGSPPHKDGVIPDIDRLKKLLFDYNGDIHRPYYIKLSWGKLIFQGVLTSLIFNYKLFRSDGTPIRATAKVSLKEFKDIELIVEEQRDSSPDLTHIRTVKEGDTLPLMAHRIYGDSKYYLELARVNNIINFRNLKAGTEIFFPPIDQSE